jgi:hypothetical protein
MGKMRNAYKTLVIKHEWKRQLGKFRHRWEVDSPLKTSLNGTLQLHLNDSNSRMLLYKRLRCGVAVCTE